MMELPRVTDIIKGFTTYQNVPKEILENAASRGTKVHSLCSGIAKGNWIPDGMIGDEFLGYVNSFKQWSEAQVEEYNIIEKRFMDEVRGYSGQVDFVIKGQDGEVYLVDLKTSAKPQKTYPVQMAAYENLLKIHEIPIKGAMLVYLNKDGQFPEIQYLDDMKEEWSVFVAALECWNYFNKRKKGERESYCLSKDPGNHGRARLYSERRKNS